MGKLYCKVEKKWCKALKRGVCTICSMNINEVCRCPRLEEIETIRFYDLLKTVRWEDVSMTIQRLDPDQIPNIPNYEGVFNKLMGMTPLKHRLTDLFINITRVAEDNGNYWLDVDGIDIRTKHRYGIEFCRWIEWVSMFITQETLDEFSPEEIIASCLWEMTFFGFTEKTIDTK